MLRQRGPRTDVARMSRVQHLASALAFLFWGCLFLGLWLLTGYVGLVSGLARSKPEMKAFDLQACSGRTTPAK